MKTRNRIFKLRSGEDVIANLKGKSGEKYILERPMSIKITTLHGIGGIPQEKILMRNWLSTSTTNEIKIPEDWIIAITTPTPDIDTEYKKSLDAEDIEPPMNNTAGLPESYLKMIEDIKKEEEKMMDQRNKTILINMSIPPQVFMEMMRNGLIEGFGGEMEEDDDDDWFFDSNRFNDDHEGF